MSKSPDDLTKLGEVIRLTPDRGIPKGPLTFYRVEDAEALEPAPYLVKGIFEPGSLGVVYGPPKSGKSFFMLHVAWHVALNESVLGKRVRGAPVIYCALEGGAGFKRRIKALIEKHGVKPSAFFYIAQSANFFSDDAAIEALIAFAVGVGAKLIVIDTLARAMPGGDENTGKDMGHMIGHLDRLKEATGACVCLVHHSGKDEAKGLRGSSALLGAVDVSILVGRDKDTGLRRYEIEANKDGAEGEGMDFKLERVTVGIDDDDEDIFTCVVQELEGYSQPKSKPQTLTPEEKGWHRAICEFYIRHPEIVQEVQKGSLAPPSRVVTKADLIPFLIEQGRLAAAPVTGDVTKDQAETKKTFRSNQQKLSKWLIRLKDRGKLGLDRDHLWLIGG